MAARKHRPRRDARRRDSSLPDPRPAVVATLAPVDGKLRVTTSAPVVVVGTPGIRWVEQLPTAVDVESPTVIDLTYPDVVDAGTGAAIELPANDPAIRTRFGGFIAAYRLLMG